MRQKQTAAVVQLLTHCKKILQQQFSCEHAAKITVFWDLIPSRFDSRQYQKKKVVGLERGSLSLVSTTEELLDRKVAAPV
jgi:hypothetical protein